MSDRHFIRRCRGFWLIEKDAVRLAVRPVFIFFRLRRQNSKREGEDQIHDESSAEKTPVSKTESTTAQITPKTIMAIAHQPESPMSCSR